MAEWKKIIVSGSTAALASINADGTVSASIFSASMGFHGDGSGLTNISATTASYVSGSNVDGEVANATTASYIAVDNIDGAITASYVTASNIDNFDTDVSRSVAASGFGSGGGDVSSMDTGSFYISSSITSSGDHIVFTQGDGTTETVIVDNVQNAVSASLATTASYVDLSIVLEGSGVASSSAQVVSLIEGQDVNLGTVTATELVTNIVSSSISLLTGSNIFGDELTDNHEFTGSVNVTGSVTATSFVGDGSGLTGVSASIADTASYVEWEDINDTPDGLISGAAQIAPDVTYNNIPLWSGSFQDSLISQINGGGRISSGSGTYINNVAVGGLTGSGLFNLAGVSDGQDLTADVSYLNSVNFTIPINSQAHARSLVGSVNEDDINFTDQTDVSLLTEPITWRFEKVGGGATFEAEFYFVIHQPNSGGGNQLTFRFGWQPGTPSDLPAGFTNGVANADSVLEATGTWDDDAPYVLTRFISDSTSSNTVDIDGALTVTGSITANSLTLSNITASAGNTFTLQVDDSGSVSAAEAVSSDTGSLLTTASIASGSDITFTKGDGTTFDIIVDSVDSASVADLATTASHVAAADVFGNVATASFALTASYAMNADAADISATSASFINAGVIVGTENEVTVASSSATGGTITIGLPDDVTIAGNLTVQGTQTNLNVANLDVEDRFITLNSGSAAGDAGIVFNQGGNVGPALGYDQSATRLGYQLNLSGSATAIAPDAFVTLTSEGGSGENAPADASLDSAVEQKGSIFIGDNGDIYIYS